MRSDTHQPHLFTQPLPQSDANPPSVPASLGPLLSRQVAHLVTPGPDGTPRWGDEALCLIRLSEFCKLIEPSPKGRPRHVSALYRYMRRGIGGVRLEGWKLPDGWYTSLAAWYGFVARLTEMKRGVPSSPPPAQQRAGQRRHVSLEAQIETVRAQLRRKPKKTKEQGQSPPSR
jgi:hypothetical protein